MFKIFFGIDGTRPAPKWWDGSPFLISAASRFRNGKLYVVRKPPKGEFFLDSGGFSFFSKAGKYPFSPDEYLEFVRKQKPDYFATMDYPCEPEVNRSNLKSNKDRIEATVDYGVYLWRKRAEVASKLIPVVQGYLPEEYAYCYELYRKRGVNADYWAFGSMCRRWNVAQIIPYLQFFRSLVGKEAKIHVFGLKISAISDVLLQTIDSIDTAAWAYAGHTGGYGGTEENFFRYKEKIERRLLAAANSPLFKTALRRQKWEK